MKRGQHVGSQFKTKFEAAKEKTFSFDIPPISFLEKVREKLHTNTHTKRKKKNCTSVSKCV